jgi:hypothetical protein
MQTTVRIVDWRPGTPQETRPVLRLVSKTITAGELIAQRVAVECSAFDNRAQASAAEHKQQLTQWLVIPGDDERTLNGSNRSFGPTSPGADRIDPNVQIAVARKAFEARQFVMLFDGAQVDSWDQRLVIGADSVATFIKLTPLRGG